MLEEYCVSGSDRVMMIILLGVAVFQLFKWMIKIIRWVNKLEVLK